MLKRKVFVDGVETPVGLTLWGLLRNRSDLELSCYEPFVHEGRVSRIDIAREADFAILCGNASSSLELLGHLHEGPRIIDTSGAYLSGGDVVCGLPEFFRENSALIREARVVGIPNAVASASISLLHPLFEAGYLAPRLPISIHAVQGYSALEASETRSRAETAARAERAVFRTLQTTSIDRELREIKRWTRPPQAIQLATSIGNFARGTAVHIPLFQSNLTPHHTLEDAYSLLERWYLDSCHVRVTRGATPADGIAVGEVSDTNILELYCLPGSSEESGLLAARLDNLGRGSARAAIQALNIMLDRRADFALDGCLQPECR